MAIYVNHKYFLKIENSDLEKYYFYLKNKVKKEIPVPELKTLFNKITCLAPRYRQYYIRQLEYRVLTQEIVDEYIEFFYIPRLLEKFLIKLDWFKKHKHKLGHWETITILSNKGLNQEILFYLLEHDILTLNWYTLEDIYSNKDVIRNLKSFPDFNIFAVKNLDIVNPLHKLFMLLFQHSKININCPQAISFLTKMNVLVPALCISKIKDQDLQKIVSNHREQIIKELSKKDNDALFKSFFVEEKSKIKYVKLKKMVNYYGTSLEEIIRRNSYQKPYSKQHRKF